MQVNLRTHLYNEAIKRNLNVNDWINELAEKELFPEKQKKE